MRWLGTSTHRDFSYVTGRQKHPKAKSYRTTTTAASCLLLASWLTVPRAVRTHRPYSERSLKAEAGSSVPSYLSEHPEEIRDGRDICQSLAPLYYGYCLCALTPFRHAISPQYVSDAVHSSTPSLILMVTQRLIRSLTDLGILGNSAFIHIRLHSVRARFFSLEASRVYHRLDSPSCVTFLYSGGLSASISPDTTPR